MKIEILVGSNYPDGKEEKREWQGRDSVLDNYQTRITW